MENLTTRENTHSGFGIGFKNWLGIENHILTLLVRCIKGKVFLEHKIFLSSLNFPPTLNQNF